MKQRAQISGLNPDRADSVIGGRGRGAGGHVRPRRATGSWCRAAGSVRDSRSVARTRRSHRPRWVRTISVATLSARFATWDSLAAERRTTVATRLHDALDPESRDVIHEMLVHASNVLDVGRAIDYYDRFEHAAMIVTSADLGGFTHETLGILSAILRQADDDIRLGPYRRLIEVEDRSAVLRAATVLALADELKRRIRTSCPPSSRARGTRPRSSSKARSLPDGGRAVWLIGSDRCSGDRSTC